jgi:CBS domain-containing protein
MLARDLAEDYPTVTEDTDALEAARLLGRHHLPGLVVLSSDGKPKAILPGSQVLRFVIPNYVQDDPSLARVLNEKAADRLVNELTGRTVGDLLPKDPRELPVLKGEDTTLEIAALMAQARCPLVAIVENGRMLGVVTVTHLLEVALHGTAEA